MQKKLFGAILCTLLMSSTSRAAEITEFFQKWWDFNKTNLHALIPQTKTTPVSAVDALGLEDLVGNHPAVLDDIIDFFQHRQEREAQGLEMPRGILFCGPAGTGKTSYAKALARDLGMNYIEISASDLEEVFVGYGASKLRALFADARKKQPCVIVIDEIDALGNRDSFHGSLHRQLIDALLAEMDGVHTSGDILVIGTTNEVNLVDKALRRPGRFDYVVEIPLPDEESRKAIIEYYLKKKKHDADIDLQIIVRDSKGFSGAELKEVVKRAMMASVRNKHAAISQEDLNDGFKQLVKERNNRR